MILRKFKMTWKKVAVVGMCSIALACGGSDDESETETASETDNPEASEAVGSLTPDKPELFMAKSNDAIQSAQMGALQLTTAKLFLDGDDEEGDDEGDEQKGTKSVNDPLCSKNADPWDAVEDKIMQTGDDYIQRKFYCKVNSATIESRDSIAGFLQQMGSILCSMKEVYEVSVDDYTEAGKEHVTDDNKMMSFSEACWPQGAPGGGDSEGDDMELVEDEMSIELTSVVTKSLPEDSGYQYSLYLYSESQDVEFTLRFFAKDGIFGFATSEPGNAPASGDSVAITVDTKKGVLLFNEVADRAPGESDGDSDQDIFRGVSRLHVKGKLDKDLKFSEIEKGAGYIYQSGPGYDGSDDNSHTFQVYAVNGNSEKGWKWTHFGSTEESMDTVENRDSFCSDGDATCEDSEDFASAEEIAAYFKASAATRAEWKSFGESGKPLCDPTSEDAKFVDLSATPNSTGAFGVCSE